VRRSLVPQANLTIREELAVRPLLALLALTTLGFADTDRKDDGFTPLFNGVDLTGWEQYGSSKENWNVEKDMIVCQGRGGGWLGTLRDYADFEVRLEYRLKPGGTSGVYIRAPVEGHISRDGMEIQILDDPHPSYANIDYYQYTGSIYHVVPPKRRAAKPAGQWNAMAVRAHGRQVQVKLNGITVVDADLDQCRKDPAVAKEHPGLARATGKIGLQSHTDRVEFRNIRIKVEASGAR
jgi:hypothetical protein